MNHKTYQIYNSLVSIRREILNLEHRNRFRNRFRMFYNINLFYWKNFIQKNNNHYFHYQLNIDGKKHRQNKTVYNLHILQK